MLDFLAGFDALGAGTLIGSLLFLGGLIRVLVDNRSFDELNRSTMAADGVVEGREGREGRAGREREDGREGHEGRAVSGRTIPLEAARTKPTGRGNEPRRPGSRRRAA